MYPLLILLLLLNVSLLAWNLVLSPDAHDTTPPLTEKNIHSLDLRTDVEGLVYKSSADGTQSSCYTVGPYNSERAAQLLAEKIRGFGLDAQLRPMRSMETLNFLVYIPPLENHEQAEKTVTDILHSEVKEATIIEDGPYKNAVSLGFFNNLNKAKRHAEYVRYLGYDARYTEQQTQREVYWLDYDEPFGSNTPVVTWSEGIDASSDVQRIPRACHH